MLIEQIKKDIIQAMKDKDVVKKEILRLVVGEAQLAESKLQKGKFLAEEEVHRIMRKILEGNEEVISHNPSNSHVLKQENEILETYLPKLATMTEIEAVITVYAETAYKLIKEAKNDGQAMGIAMKFLKDQKLNVLGQDVREVVNKIRNE